MFDDSIDTPDCVGGFLFLNFLVFFWRMKSDWIEGDVDGLLSCCVFQDSHSSGRLFFAFAFGGKALRLY